MGKRPAGKPKKKSIKANVTSQFSSKRKLSRMGKKLKKGKMGPSTEFVTRSTALKKLQISLKDFRRLCILKGIYPKVPTKAPKGSDKVYYDIKDLAFLSHEPLLAKFREFKSFMKKIRKAAGRNQFDEARRKNMYKPTMILDHLVKERYPRFVDALRDLDDALCMIHLFAALPSVGRITSSHTTTCKELVTFWQFYIAKAKCLNKVFVSVKGVYYQAEIMGEKISWLVPHAFTQAIPKDVDFRVMVTFLEFYETFLKFVLFKLYNTISVSYPPEIDQKLHDAGSYLMSVKLHHIEENGDEKDVAKIEDAKQPAAAAPAASTTNKQQNKAVAAKLASLESKMSKLQSEEDQDGNDSDDEGVDTEQLKSAFSHLHDSDDEGEGEEEARAFGQPTTDAATEHETRAKLFKGLVFFVNREVSLELMQMCVLSFGGLIGWEGPGSPFNAKDSRITHHIIDRPLTAEMKTQLSPREFVQPQWVVDSVNAVVRLPVFKYAPGVPLPPHLSPFVDDAKEGYVPQYRQEIALLKGEGDKKKEGSEDGSDMDEEELESEDDEAELAAKKRAEKASKKRNQQESESESESGDEEEDEEDDDDDEDESGEDEMDDDEDNSEDDDEEEVEEDDDEEEDVPVVNRKGPKGVVYSNQSNSNNSKKSNNKRSAEEDFEGGEELARIMMSKKTKRLYDRMQHGLDKKKEQVDTLQAKRQKIEQKQQKQQQAPSASSKGSKQQTKNRK